LCDEHHTKQPGQRLQHPRGVRQPHGDGQLRGERGVSFDWFGQRLYLPPRHYSGDVAGGGQQRCEQRLHLHGDGELRGRCKAKRFVPPAPEHPPKHQNTIPLDLSLAPNPATTQVRFKVSGLGEKTGELLVFDGLGRMVLRQVLAPEQNDGTFDVSDLPEGLYRVSLRTEQQVVTKGLIVLER